MSNLCSLNLLEWGQNGDVPVHSDPELRELFGEFLRSGESEDLTEHEQASN